MVLTSAVPSTATPGSALTTALALSHAAIRFPTSAEPAVSVIVAAQPDAPIISAFLHALAAQALTCAASFEVFLVAASVDHRLLAQENTVRCVSRLDEAVAAARGAHLLLLSSASQLLPGALDALLAPFARGAAVGIVGGCLLSDDGTIRAAGGFFRDADTLLHAYFAGGAPARPEWRFRRPVGFVRSMLMLPGAVYESLGGLDLDTFDQAGAEVDLCIRCRKSGLSVVYEPRALAVGSDEPSHDERALRERHAAWLFARPPARSQSDLELRDFRDDRLRILYIDDRVPHADFGAGLPRANTIVTSMVRLGYFVSIFPLLDDPGALDEAYRDLPIEIEILDRSAFPDIAGLFLQRRSYYDVVWISRSSNIVTVDDALSARGLDLRGEGDPVLVFDAEAVGAMREAMQQVDAGKPALGAHIDVSSRREIALYGRADTVTCVSNAERRIFAQLGLHNTKVLGHLLEAHTGTPGFAARRDIVFTGNLMHRGLPNHRSIAWFAAEVWPRVREALGEAVAFSVIGAIDPTIAGEFTERGLRVLGRVDDLDAALDAARVAVAPTRFAAGLPHKVHAAMSRGLPIVMTRLLSIQVGANEADFMVADDPSAFAAAIVRLYQEEALWQSVRAAGLDLIRAECPATFVRTIRDICEPDRL